jgi:hypothetical protein
MTRHRVLCGLLLGSAVLAYFGGWLWIASKPQVTRARFEQVKEGMSREEVIRTVGGPPGDYREGRRPITPDLDRFFGVEDAYWVCDEGALMLYFDEAGIVTDPWVTDVANCPPSTFTERIRRWLGL